LSREYPQHPIPGVAAITIKDNHILLTVRGKEPSKGMWGLPGGVVEIGETRVEALIREVYEETNIIVEPIELLTVFDSINKDRNEKVKYHYILFEYLCKFVSGDLKPGDDAPDAQWVSIDALSSIPIMTSTLRFIEKTLKQREFI
jgi:ADP-ribose pyrophosphatase YjhB (NUDIX family)